MSARSIIRIDFCCNDPDNGLFEGRVSQTQLAGEVLELEAANWSGLSFRGCPSIRFGGKQVTLSGKSWPALRWKSWYGNWCWDAVWMPEQTLREFLVWLHGTAKFRANSGLGELVDAWNSDAPLPLQPELAEATHPLALELVAAALEAQRSA